MPVVYVVSDSIGETGEAVARAAVAQFAPAHVEIRRVALVNDAEGVREVVQQAAHERSMIAYTIVVPQLRRHMAQEAAAAGVPAVDIMGPMVDALARVTGLEPSRTPGLVHRLDADYFRRVEAVEFAVRYDDGKDPRGLHRADVVLAGVSRTSKTPVSMYLAQHSLKVANTPLVPEVPPPEELFDLPFGKVIGLRVDPEHLHAIRMERLKTIGLAPHANYASMARIMAELDYANTIFRRLGCPVVDVTRKAVEETAVRVLEILHHGSYHTGE